MIWLLACTAASLDTVGPAPVAPDWQARPLLDDERWFDFWAGTWSVDNQTSADGDSWSAAGLAEARIQPVVGDRAVLERWDGDPVFGGHLYGFSLRSWHAERGLWEVELNWPGGSDPRFFTMEGAPEGQVLHIQSPSAGGRNQSRFTFSHPAPDSARWTESNTTNAGQDWTETWRMTFTRTGDPMAATAASLAPTPVGTPACADDPAQRGLDGWIGTWRGQGFHDNPDGTQALGDAQVTAASMIEGCGLLLAVDVDYASGDAYQGLLALAWSRGQWSGRWVTSLDGRIHRLQGQVQDDVLVLTGSETIGTSWAQVTLDGPNGGVIVVTGDDGETWVPGVWALVEPQR